MLSSKAVYPFVCTVQHLFLDILLESFVFVGVAEFRDFLSSGLNHVVESVAASLNSFVIKANSLLVLFLFCDGGH